MKFTFREAEKYLRKPEHVEHMAECNESDQFKQLARSLLVVASTPPIESYETFTAKVRDYNQKEPFYFVTPQIFNTNKYIKVCSNEITKILNKNSKSFSSLSPSMLPICMILLSFMPGLCMIYCVKQVQTYRMKSFMMWLVMEPE